MGQSARILVNFQMLISQVFPLGCQTMTFKNPIRMLLSSTTPSGEQEDKWSLDGVFGGFSLCHQNKQ